jgi:hypothetical protein
MPRIGGETHARVPDHGEDLGLPLLTVGGEFFRGIGLFAGLLSRVGAMVPEGSGAVSLGCVNEATLLDRDLCVGPDLAVEHFRDFARQA